MVPDEMPEVDPEKLAQQERAGKEKRRHWKVEVKTVVPFINVEGVWLSECTCPIGRDHNGYGEAVDL